jgi:hypothetical protein
MFQQQPNDLGVAGPSGKMQGKATGAKTSVHLGPSLEQGFRNLMVVQASRLVQWASSPMV